MRRIVMGLIVCGCLNAAEGPRMGASVNGLGQVTLYRGWPAVVAATVFSGEGQTVRLGARQGAWTTGLRVSPDWPLRMLEADEARLNLDANNAAQAVWLLTPEDSAQLAAGVYLLRVSLDTNDLAGEGDWKGAVAAPAVVVEVKDEPESLSLDQSAEKAMARSHYEELNGNLEGAMAATGELLEKQPSSLVGLTRKAQLLLTAGRHLEATGAFTEAIRAFKEKYPEADHPPRLLLRGKSEALWRASGLEP